MATRRQQLDPALVALAGVHAATSLALARVFAGANWWFAALGAVVGAHGLAYLLDRTRRRGVIALPAQVFAALWYCAVVVVPERTVLAVVPTFGGVGDLLQLLGRAGSTLRGAIVPVPPVGAALALALIATWAAAAAAQWSQSRLDGTLAALVPSLALFIAVAALGKGSSWWAGLAWAIAASGFLLIVHAHRETGSRSPFRSQHAHRSRMLTGGAAALVATCAVATLVAPVLPGARSTGWFDYRALGVHGDGGGTVHAVSPLDDIGAQLNDSPEAELFKVDTNDPSRWRLVALDAFDGQQWTSTTTPASAFAPSGWSQDLPTVRVEREFHIGPMSGRFLPVAYEPQSVTGIGRFQVIGNSAVFVDDKNHQGDSYTVESVELAATAEALRAASTSRNGGRGSEPSPETTELPIDFPDDVRRLAEQVVRVAGATNDFDRALALQNYLRGDDFTYDQTVRFSNPRRALSDFLFTKRRGFCQQFAGAMAAMARAIGLPSRVAVGFQPGTRQDDGYHVTNKDAHAWPEVWVRGAGWIAFEPTKGRFDTTDPNDPTGTGHQAPTASTTTTSRPGGSTTTKDPFSSLTTKPFRDSPNATGSATRTSARGLGPWARGALVAGGLVLLVVFANFVRLALARRRRQRREHAASRRARVHGAWFEALDALARVGVERRASATAVEFARGEPAKRFGGIDAPLLTLAQLHTAASFGPDDPSDEQAARAWSCADEIVAVARTRRLPRPWWRRMLVWG